MGLLLFANMAEQEAASCLAEIPTPSKEIDPASKSGRSSLAKLPKLGFFSTSKCSAETEPIPVLPTQLEDNVNGRVSSKPPSRQRQAKDEASRVTAQRLDILIDLPNITSSLMARSCDGDRGSSPDEKSNTRRKDTSKSESGTNSRQLWERNRSKEDRVRTKTWPSLQYQLWLDASNLPLHFLCDDERANRPLDYFYPQRGKKKSNLLSIRSNSSVKVDSTNILKRDVSSQYLSVSKPPVRPNMSSGDVPTTRMRKGSSDVKQNTSTELEAAATDVHLGAGKSWQVASSYIHKRSEYRNSSGSRSNTPHLGLSRLPQKPRLPSRMGQNNLEAFLKQTNLTHKPVSRDSNRTERPASPSKLATFISPRHFCNTSAEVHLLSLRSYARNPTLLQEFAETGQSNLNHMTVNISKKEEHSAILLDKCQRDEFSRLQSGGMKHVRFTVPCGSERESGSAKVVSAKTKKESSTSKRPWSDVTPPTTPPTLDTAFRIKCYITPIKSTD